MTKDKQLVVGIDIAANTFHAAWGTQAETINQATEYAQTQGDYKRLIGKLKTTGYDPTQIVIVIEATGTYWMRLARTLYQTGFQVSVINPRQAYHYAQALLQQAKTDACDARLLAKLGLSMSLKVWQAPSDAWEALYQRLVERDNLVELRQVLRNQLHALLQRTQIDPSVEARKQALIDTIDAQVKAIDRELKTYLQQSEWARMAECLLSIKGIGLLSAAWLLVITNGFSTCDDAEQLASYLGVVPHPHQSGSSRRGHKPTGRSGHSRARRVLYQASVSAAFSNPIISVFYDRLCAAGKHVKVARIATTRKLIHIAFAIATREQLFDPHYLPAAHHPTLAA